MPNTQYHEWGMCLCTMYMRSKLTILFMMAIYSNYAQIKELIYMEPSHIIFLVLFEEHENFHCGPWANTVSLSSSAIPQLVPVRPIRTAGIKLCTPRDVHVTSSALFQFPLKLSGQLKNPFHFIWLIACRQLQYCNSCECFFQTPKLKRKPVHLQS